MNAFQPASLFKIELPDNARLIATLLAARAATAGASNRRALFARMDEMLGRGGGRSGDGPAGIDGSVPETSRATDGGELVRLTRLRMRNWKSFENADIALPAHRDGRSLVVIGGPNGYGKSSILEAFSFGLFGRRAISDLGTLIGGAGRGDQRRSYKTILQRTLHRSARALSDGSCSVVLDFQAEAGPVQVERRWYFDDAGELMDDDEELLVRVGEDGTLLKPPVGVVQRDWQQAEVERLIMPAGLAPFFVFDGEQIEHRADGRLADQVRTALTRLLGLDDLAGLAADLRDYAKDRERNIADHDVSAVDRLRNEVARAAQELTAGERALRAVNDNLGNLRSGRDQAFAALSSAETTSHADMQHALEAEHTLRAERRQLEREVVAALAEDGPLMLVGAELAAAAAARLLLEADQMDALVLDKTEFEALWARFVAVRPPLDAATTSAMRARLELACTASHAASKPSGTRVPLDRTTRRDVIGKLQGAVERGRKRLRAASAAVAANAEEINRVRLNASDQAAAASARAEARFELARVSELIRAAEAERIGTAQRVTVLHSDLAAKRADLDRLEIDLKAAEPRVRSARVARSLASSLDDHAAEIADGEHGRFAAAVTTSFREMAHKDQIARIDISRDGRVVLTDAQGHDVSDYPLSAGESQLFAMALVAAVGALAGDRLPLIVDTPLGRLDTQHRQNVLDMLSRRRAQTIMLTQPEEISPARLSKLEPVLAMSAEIRHVVDPATGVGVSRIEAACARTQR